MGQKSILITLLLSLVSFSFASNTIKGYIYDGETGFAVPGVQVFLADSSKGVTTDNSGYFYIPGLGKKAEIILQHVKYYPQNREISFDNGNQIFTSYYLYAKTLEIDSVVVWGDAYFPGRYETDFGKIKTKVYSEPYKQYLQMLKRKHWSWQELETYALWTILEQKYFDSYWNLKSRSERAQFLDLFWKKMDPTPNTTSNEFRDEFERRIRYNWTHFSSNDSSGIAEKPDRFQTVLDTLIGAKSFKHESQDHLRPWSKRAPWDARGTLYLKYGEPTSHGLTNLNYPEDIDISRFGWNTNIETDLEAWYYGKLGVDFNIFLYKTNIFKKAILPGERSMNELSIQYSDVELDVGIDEFYNNYVDKKIFLADFETEKSIDDFEFKFVDNAIIFTFTPEYFRSIRDKSYYSLVSVNYKIVNKSQPEIAMKKDSPFMRNLKTSDVENLEISLPVNLSPGEYSVELNIEDHNSGKKLNDTLDLTVQ